MGVNFARSMLLAKSNIRKARGQTSAMIALVLLSSMMMNLWLMLSMDYRKNFDRCHDRLNDGHVNLAAYVTDDSFEEYISELLAKRSDIAGYTVTPAYCEPLSFKYNDGEMSQLAVILKKEDVLSRNVGRMEITEESTYDSGIYFPMLYGMGDNYSMGEKANITLLGEEYEYTVCGFFNSAMMGSHNCNMMALLLTEDKFEEFSGEQTALRAVYVSARVSDIFRSEEISNELKKEITKEFPDIVVNANDYEMITTSRYISQMICAGILSAMAFLVLLIGVVVISSNIVNYIQENMQSLGALKAVGYTGRQIISSIIMQFAGISAIAAVIGTALSYSIFPTLNEMMVAQTGIPYEVRFQPLPAVFTVIFITGVICTAVYISAGRIKRIEPITAMRQGISTHSFRKNHLPLERTPLPVNAALAMKTTLGSVKQNVTVCVTMLVVSLVLVFSVTMFRNMVIDKQPFLDMIAGEYTDAAINVNLDREEELISFLTEDSRVEKFYLFTANNIEVQLAEGASLSVTVTDDASKFNNKVMFIEGRYPIYGNEIAVAAKYAKDSGIKMGDEISVNVGKNQKKYIVSGFTQNTNSLGKDCVMTREGYEKLALLPNVTYYANLKEGSDVDEFNSELSERFGSDVNALQNVASIIESSSYVYVMLANAIVIAIAVISCIVITFVMYLLVRTLLNNKKRDYGILKALGFTTSQLVLQTAMSFMPAVIIFSVIGITVSLQIINPLLALFLGGIGVVKGMFIVPAGLSAAAGAAVILFTFGAACLLSMRVKKIAPWELLTGE